MTTKSSHVFRYQQTWTIINNNIHGFNNVGLGQRKCGKDTNEQRGNNENIEREKKKKKSMRHQWVSKYKRPKIPGSKKNMYTSLSSLIKEKKKEKKHNRIERKIKKKVNLQEGSLIWWW